MEILENNEPRFHDGKLIGVRTETETFRTEFKSNFRTFCHLIPRLYKFSKMDWSLAVNCFSSLFNFGMKNKVVIATIIFPSSDQNRAAVKDLGYEITDNDDIEFELICPAEFDDDIPTLEQLLLDYEQWKKILDTPDLYKGQKMEVPKRELSKILCEFFLPITDGRK